MGTDALLVVAGRGRVAEMSSPRTGRYRDAGTKEAGQDGVGGCVLVQRWHVVGGDTGEAPQSQPSPPGCLGRKQKQRGTRVICRRQAALWGLTRNGGLSHAIQVLLLALLEACV